MNIDNYINKQVFEVDPDLAIREELLSIHSINPFTPTLSSSRSYMSSSHMSQSVTLETGDEKIIQTGLEKQFGSNTFSRKAETDIRILKKISRYNGVGLNAVNNVTETLYIVEDLETGELDYINVEYKHTQHQYFGFKFVQNNELLNTLTVGSVVNKGTIFADSPAVSSNSGYKYGVNANTALMTIPETAEDGIVISKSLSEKLHYKIYESRVVEFGSDKFPLNIYGDEDDYKSFPEIGESINEDSVLMVLRAYDPDLSPATTSKKDVMEFNPVFDEAVYVKGPGENLLVAGSVIKSGVVVDIKAYTSKKFKKEVYTGTKNTIDKYVNGYRKYYQDILDTYEDLKKDHYRRYRNNDMLLSEKLHRLLVDAMAIVNQHNEKIAYSYRNEPLDIYRLEFTIEYTIVLTPSVKMSDLAGSKGVVVSIIPDEEMPIDVYGNRADVIMDPGSVVSRMNAGRLYEQYFNAVSRHAQYHVKKMLPADINTYDDSHIDSVFDYVLGLLEMFDTEQYPAYKQIDNRAEKETILLEIVNEELYLLYRVSSKRKPYQIIGAVRGSVYEPIIDHVTFVTDGVVKKSIEKIMIAPIYTILLAKTSDNFLSCATAKTNHYGLPIGVGNSGRNRLPWRNSPVKILSETESRLYVSYVSRLALAELKDRGNSLTSHEEIYNNILTSKSPTDIGRVIDRNKFPYGNDVSLDLINNIFNCAGFEMKYVKDKNKFHHKK